MPSACTVVGEIGRPVLVVGHSSGGVLALEAMGETRQSTADLPARRRADAGLARRTGPVRGLDAYARLEIPVVFRCGERSPAHLHDRTEVLARVMPQVKRVVVLPGQGHNANDRAPDEVARVVGEFAGELFG